MPEDLTNALRQFMPTLPDRDALLFAAGRASARPAPIWKVLCGVLAVSQFSMMAFWLGRPTPTVNTIAPPAIETTDDEPSPFTPDTYSYIALSKAADLNPPRIVGGPVETDRSAPPLKAGWRGELPN